MHDAALVEVSLIEARAAEAALRRRMGSLFTIAPHECEPLSGQVERLAKIIIAEFGGPTEREGACDTAIRIMRRLAAELSTAEYRAEKAEADARCVTLTDDAIATDTSLYRGNSCRYWWDKVQAYKDAFSKRDDEMIKRRKPAQALVAAYDERDRLRARLAKLLAACMRFRGLLGETRGAWDVGKFDKAIAEARSGATDAPQARLASLAEAAEPLIRWLSDLHPHHVVIVKDNGAELFEGELAHKTNAFLKD
jgi:hypothetical protein